MALGAAVNAKVVAYNAYGSSSTSAVGSGAIIQLVPSAPVALSNNATLTLDSQIGIYWNEGASNGDSPVIDYSVFYMQSGASTFVQLASGVTSRSYLTTVSLTQGTTYVFTVKARNSVGLSAQSATLSVLAAQIPA